MLHQLVTFDVHQWLTSDEFWDYLWKSLLTIAILWVIYEELKPR